MFFHRFSTRFEVLFGIAFHVFSQPFQSAHALRETFEFYGPYCVLACSSVSQTHDISIIFTPFVDIDFHVDFESAPVSFWVPFRHSLGVLLVIIFHTVFCRTNFEFFLFIGFEIWSQMGTRARGL